MMKMKKVRMILVLSVLIVLIAGSLHAGGQKDEEQDNGSRERILKIFLPQSPGTPEGVEAVAKAYMKEHPDVTVVIRSAPFNRYKEQLQVMWASDDVDDIIVTGAPDIPNFAYYGALMPVTDILPSEEQKAFLPSAVEAVTFEGELYAYPFREEASAMFYNKSYFEMAGVVAPPVDAPWTWQQWLEQMKKVQAAVQEKEGKTIWGLTFLSNPGRGDFWLTPIIRSAGSRGSNTWKGISEDGKILTGYADTSEAMEAYRFYQNLYTTEGICPAAEVPDAFGTGQSATFISFLASASQLERNFPDLDWGLMPVPYFKTPMVHTGGFTYAISAKSDMGDLAKDFIRFAGSEEGINIYFGTSGSSLVSRKDFGENYPHYFEQESQIFFREVLEMYGEARPKTPFYVLYNQIMGFDLFMDLAAGGDVKATVDRYIEEFERQAQAQ